MKKLNMSDFNITAEQKEAANKAANTAKKTALLAAKRGYQFLKALVARLLSIVHLERFAAHLTILLLFSVVVTVLNMVPGFSIVAHFAADVIAKLISFIILAVVGIKLFGFIKRCVNDVRAEEAQQQESASDSSDKQI